MVRVPILLYHWFHTPGEPLGASPEFGITPADFRRQMTWLGDHGWTGITLGELVAAVDGETTLPARPVVITFDDGYRDFLDHALDVLVSRRLPATIFTVADRVGGSNAWDRQRGEPARELLDWPELRRLGAAGIEIGSHSLSHPDLRTLDDSALEREAKVSRAELEERLGQPVRHFAYPHGLHDQRVRRAVAAAGYESASAVLLRPGDLLRSRRFSLMRVIVHADRGFANFRLRLRLASPPHRAARAA